MRTAVLSDLHLGTRSRIDLLREPAVRERLLGRLAGFDRLVLLGDAIELRDRPIAQAIEEARPFLEGAGAALGNGQVVLVPGNHDHRLAHEALDLSGRRRRGERLPLSLEVPVGATGAAGAIRRALRCELVIAYPGLALGDGVWATHGHYLDAHSSWPTFESVAAAAIGAVRRRPERALRSPEDYEAILAPTYDLYFEIAQRRQLERFANLARWLVRRVEARLGTRGPAATEAPAGDPTRLPRLRLRGSRLGTAPGERRRPGLKPFSRVLERLSVDAEHVLFGHTHRTGPLPGDDPGAWRTPAGIALWNTGCWVYEAAFVRGGEGSASAYWPGTLASVDGSGPPQLHRLLEDFTPSRTHPDRLLRS
jgi:Calcineurin-like phosphoesterase